MFAQPRAMASTRQAGSSRHWAGLVSVSPTQTGTLERQDIICLLPKKSDTHPFALLLPHPISSQSLSTAAYLTTQNSMEKVTTLHFPLFFPSHFIPFPQLLTQEGGCWPGGQNPALEFTQTCIKSRHLKQATPVNLGVMFVIKHIFSSLCGQLVSGKQVGFYENLYS